MGVQRGSISVLRKLRMERMLTAHTRLFYRLYRPIYYQHDQYQLEEGTVAVAVADPAGQGGKGKNGPRRIWKKENKWSVKNIFSLLRFDARLTQRDYSMMYPYTMVGAR